jgi:DNA-binding CsgD family transcriptional regulator
MHTPLDDDVYRLWDDLADHGAQDMQAALALCLRTLCDWTGSHNGYWMGLVRLPHKNGRSDLLKGWRIGASVEMLRPEFTTPARMQHGTPIMQTPTADAAAEVIVATTGAFRSFSMCTGMFDPAANEQTKHDSLFDHQPSISSRTWIVSPVNADAESAFMFDTCIHGTSFDAALMQRAVEALRGIKWFHRQLLCEHGLGLCAEPLSPAEQRLVPELLNGDREKVIADHLGLTEATLHQYATSIYRKFGVHGRTEFMSIWLRGAALPPHSRQITTDQ